MFGVEAVEPWIGPNYGRSEPKVLVVGDSRYSKTYHDRRIVQDQVEGRRDPVFTKFTQAAIGKQTSAPGYEADARAFWDGALFYNYNTTAFPEKAGTPLDSAARADPQNARVLQEMIRAFRPTHAIVWGFANWDSIVQGSSWATLGHIPLEPPELYRAMLVEGHTVLFAGVLHPSSREFRFERWAPVLSAFLSIRPESVVGGA